MSSVRLGDTDIMVVGEQKAPNEDDDDGDGELTRASASLKPSPGKSLLRKLSSKGVTRDRAQSDATASSGSSMRGASFQMTTVDGRDEALEVGKPKARFGGATSPQYSLQTRTSTSRALRSSAVSIEFTVMLIARRSASSDRMSVITSAVDPPSFWQKA